MGTSNLTRETRRLGTLRVALAVCATLGGLAVAAAQQSLAEPPISLSPASMPGITTIDERFQSYTQKILEVTGGKFWANPPWVAPRSRTPRRRSWLPAPRRRSSAAARQIATTRLTSSWRSPVVIVEVCRFSDRSGRLSPAEVRRSTGHGLRRTCGRTFWCSRNRFAGSYCDLIRARRG